MLLSGVLSNAYFTLITACQLSWNHYWDDRTPAHAQCVNSWMILSLHSLRCNREDKDGYVYSSFTPFTINKPICTVIEKSNGSIPVVEQVPSRDSHEHGCYLLKRVWLTATKSMSHSFLTSNFFFWVLYACVVSCRHESLACETKLWGSELA